MFSILFSCVFLAYTDINAKTSKETLFITPLICASKFDAYEACRLLIQRGAEVLNKTCNGQTPLHYAARKGHTRVLEVSCYQRVYVAESLKTKPEWECQSQGTLSNQFFTITAEILERSSANFQCQ